MSKLLTKKAGMCYTQILLLIVASFAFSYLIYESSGMNNNIEQENKISTLDLIGKFFSSWMERSSMKLVKAASDDVMNCCPKLKNSEGGATCKEILQTDCASKCEGNCLPTRCEQTNVCKL